MRLPACDGFSTSRNHSVITLFAGDEETVGKMSKEVDGDQRWLTVRHSDTMIDTSPAPQYDVSVNDRQPETEEEKAKTSGCIPNGRSPTSPNGECLGEALRTTTCSPEVKSPPEVTSHRGGSWESGDAMSEEDASLSVASVDGRLDDNRADVVDGDKDGDEPEPEVGDAGAIIVMSDSSPTPPPPNLVLYATNIYTVSQKQDL